MKIKVLIIFIIVVLFNQYNLNAIEKANDVYSSFCSDYDPSIFLYKSNNTQIFKNGNLIYEDDFECAFSNNFIESDDNIYFDSGSKIITIDKSTDKFNEFLVESVDEKANVIQNPANAKGYIKKNNTYYSIFTINSNQSLIKFITDGKYYEIVTGHSNVTSSVTSNQDILLTENESNLEHVTLHKLVFEDKEKKYILNDDNITIRNDYYNNKFQDFVTAFSFNQDSIYLVGNRLTNNKKTLFFVNEYDNKGVLKEKVVSKVFDGFAVRTTKYKNATMIDNKIISVLELISNKGHERKIALQVFDVKSEIVKIIESEPLSKYMSKKFSNGFVDVHFKNNILYLAFETKKGLISLYEMKLNGDITYKHNINIESKVCNDFRDFLIVDK